MYLQFLLLYINNIIYLDKINKLKTIKYLLYKKNNKNN